MILYQITNAVVQLTNDEINNILKEVDCSPEDMNKFEFAINKYKLNGSHLMLKKRHSVLLILDEVWYLCNNVITKKIIFSIFIYSI